MKILYFSKNDKTKDDLKPVLREGLEAAGTLEVVGGGAALSEAEQAAVYRRAEVALIGRDGVRLPDELATNPGALRYVCIQVGSVKPFLGEAIIDSPLQVTNWGTENGFGIAEGAMCLLLATLKDLRHNIEEVANDGWKLDLKYHGGSLQELNVGVFGCGAIGRCFIEMLKPFRAVIRVYDPFCTTFPEGVEVVESLDELFETSQAIVLHAGLTDQTRGIIDARLLAKLPKYGVVINTARGGIINQDDLFAELESGRLRAGLDVLEPDWLPPGHPAKKWRNVIFTGHSIYRRWPTEGKVINKLTDIDRLVLRNLAHFAAGEPLEGVVDRARYDLMT